MDPWLIVTLIGIFVGATVVTVTVYLINRSRLKEIAKQYAANELAFKIKTILKEGNYNVVTIGLIDTAQNETQEIEVRGEEIERNFKEGERISIY